jgi:rubrerythrin
MPDTYLQLLQRARAMENDAIAIGLQLIVLAPAQDIASLTEIARDETDHDRIYVDLISQQTLGGRVAQKVTDALRTE